MLLKNGFSIVSNDNFHNIQLFMKCENGHKRLCPFANRTVCLLFRRHPKANATHFDVLSHSCLFSTNFQVSKTGKLFVNRSSRGELMGQLTSAATGQTTSQGSVI